MTDSATRAATAAEVEMRRLREELEELSARLRLKHDIAEAYRAALVASGDGETDPVRVVANFRARLDAAEAVVRAAEAKDSNVLRCWAEDLYHTPALRNYLIGIADAQDAREKHGQ